MTPPIEAKPAELSALPDTLCSAESLEREIADIDNKLKTLSDRRGFLKRELKKYCPHDGRTYHFEGDEFCRRCDQFID